MKCSNQVVVIQDDIRISIVQNPPESVSKGVTFSEGVTVTAMVQHKQNKQTNRRTNKQTKKQTNEQTNKQTNQQIKQQINKHAHDHTHTQTPKHTHGLGIRIELYTRPRTHTYTDSLTHSLTDSLTHSLTHPLTHSLTRSHQVVNTPSGFRSLDYLVGVLQVRSSRVAEETYTTH